MTEPVKFLVKSFNTIQDGTTTMWRKRKTKKVGGLPIAGKGRNVTKGVCCTCTRLSGSVLEKDPQPGDPTK